MATNNTLTSLNTMFKYVQDQAESLLPDNSVLLRLIPKLTPPNQIGRNNFLIPVQLTHENGVTYADGGVSTLVDASAAVYSEISVPAAPMILQTVISDSVANRMANETKTFINEASLRAEVMYNSLARRYEISMLYGKSATGLGQCTTASTASGTTGSAVVTAASWSPGIWAGAVGATVYFYTAVGALVSSGADAIFTITGVTAPTSVTGTGALALSGTSTGITALSTAFNTTGVIITFQGSTSTSPVLGNDMTGLDAQIVGGASYFGIDPTVYPLWQGQTYSCSSAALTMGKVLSGAAQCVAIGGLDSELVLMVSAVTYANLNSDQASLRQYDSSYSDKENDNGSEELSYRGPNGKISIVVNNITKQGEAHGFPKKHVKRVGVKEMSFLKPGTEDQFFQELPTQTGYQIRCSGEFSVVLMKPAQAIKFTSIVNS